MLLIKRYTRLWDIDDRSDFHKEQVIKQASKGL